MIVAIDGDSVVVYIGHKKCSNRGPPSPDNYKTEISRLNFPEN